MSKQLWMTWARWKDRATRISHQKKRTKVVTFVNNVASFSFFHLRKLIWLLFGVSSFLLVRKCNEKNIIDWVRNLSASTV